MVIQCDKKLCGGKVLRLTIVTRYVWPGIVTRYVWPRIVTRYGGDVDSHLVVHLLSSRPVDRTNKMTLAAAMKWTVVHLRL